MTGGLPQVGWQCRTTSRPKLLALITCDTHKASSVCFHGLERHNPAQIDRPLSDIEHVIRSENIVFDSLRHVSLSDVLAHCQSPDPTSNPLPRDQKVGSLLLVQLAYQVGVCWTLCLKIGQYTSCLGTRKDCIGIFCLIRVPTPDHVLIDA